MPILKCVGKEDTNYILRVVHEGICGNHIGARTLTEVTIRTLNVVLRTKLKDLKGKWVEYLPEVLWAHRTTCKSATRETPLALAFGTEAVAPIEVD